MKLASAVVMIYYRTLGLTKVSRNGCGGSARQGDLRRGPQNPDCILERGIVACKFCLFSSDMKGHDG